MNVLKKIDDLRKERGWSLYKLSEESGVSQSTLTNMFVRETNPSLNTLSLICDAFEITLSDFFENNINKNLTLEETTLISKYRKLDQDEKKIVCSIINKFLRNKEKTKGLH